MEEVVKMHARECQNACPRVSKCMPETPKMHARVTPSLLPCSADLPSLLGSPTVLAGQPLLNDEEHGTRFLIFRARNEEIGRYGCDCRIHIKSGNYEMCFGVAGCLCDLYDKNNLDDDINKIEKFSIKKIAFVPNRLF